MKTLFFLLILLTTLIANDYEKGMKAFNDKDYDKALKLWLPLAKAEHAKAQNNIGMMYVNGLGVDQDPVKAVQWLEKAAKSGNADYQFNLAYVYFNGYGGVSMHQEKSKLWLKKAKDNGSKKAEELWISSGFSKQEKQNIK